MKLRGMIGETEEAVAGTYQGQTETREVRISRKPQGVVWGGVVEIEQDGAAGFCEVGEATDEEAATCAPEQGFSELRV